MRLRLFVVLTSLLLAGCSPQSVTITSLEPARAHEVTQLRRLAVMPFRGDAGGVATAAVEQALASVSVGQQRYFTLVDARILRTYLGGQGVEMQFDSQELRRKGRDSGADGVVLGTVSRAAWRDEHVMEQRSVCVAETESGSCRKLAVRKVPCIRRTGSFAFTPKVVNVGTGQIIFSTEYAEAQESLACRGTDDDLASGGALITTAQDRAIAHFLQDVAPHAVQVRVPLLLEDDSGIPETVRADIQRGAEFARTGRMDKACPLWRDAAATHQGGYALPYLLGVCAEQAGDLDRASQFYKRADQAASRPVSEVSSALERIRRSIGNRNVLTMQIK